MLHRKKDYYVLANHQKGVNSKHLYLNIALIYKELLDKSLSENEILDSFNINNLKTKLHVQFRAGSFPGAPLDLQEKLDTLAENNDLESLALLIKETLMALLNFLEKHHSREEIRRLKNSKKISAIIMRQV